MTSRPQHLLAALTLSFFVIINTQLPAALLIGAGDDLENATGREGTGQRLNIDDHNTKLLAPGTYTIEDFSFLAKVQSGATNSGGSIVPFLAYLDGTQYRLLWRGSDTALPTTLTNGQSAVVTGSTAGSFTLDTTTTIYSGFYSIGTAAVAYSTAFSEPRTDHANTNGHTYPWANTIGNAISGHTYSQQSRSYAHGITVQSTNNTRIGPGLKTFTGADSLGGERLNIDRSKPVTLSSGTHTVSSFSYFSTLASGGTLSGSVTPFLAKQNNENQWQIVWLGDAVNNSILGGNEASINETFSLTEETTLYAGFYTADGARVALANTSNGDTTAHISSSNFTITDNQTLSITGTNANLPRYYSFEILVTAVPEPSRSILILTSLALLTLTRRRPTL